MISKIAMRAFSIGSAQAAPFDYQKVFGQRPVTNFQEFPEMHDSFMKIVGSDVDTSSADY